MQKSTSDLLIQCQKWMQEGKKLLIDGDGINSIPFLLNAYDLSKNHHSLLGIHIECLEIFGKVLLSFALNPHFLTSTKTIFLPSNIISAIVPTAPRNSPLDIQTIYQISSACKTEQLTSTPITHTPKLFLIDSLNQTLPKIIPQLHIRPPNPLPITTPISNRLVAEGAILRFLDMYFLTHSLLSSEKPVIQTPQSWKQRLQPLPSTISSFSPSPSPSLSSSPTLLPYSPLDHHLQHCIQSLYDEVTYTENQTQNGSLCQVFQSDKRSFLYSIGVISLIKCAMVLHTFPLENRYVCSLLFQKVHDLLKKDTLHPLSAYLSSILSPLLIQIKCVRLSSLFLYASLEEKHYPPFRLAQRYQALLKACQCNTFCPSHSSLKEQSYQRKETIPIEDSPSPSHPPSPRNTERISRQQTRQRGVLSSEVRRWVQLEKLSLHSNTKRFTQKHLEWMGDVTPVVSDNGSHTNFSFPPYQSGESPSSRNKWVMCNDYFQFMVIQRNRNNQFFSAALPQLVKGKNLILFGEKNAASLINSGDSSFNPTAGGGPGGSLEPTLDQISEAVSNDIDTFLLSVARNDTYHQQLQYLNYVYSAINTHIHPLIWSRLNDYPTQLVVKKEISELQKNKQTTQSLLNIEDSMVLSSEEEVASTLALKNLLCLSNTRVSLYGDGCMGDCVRVVHLELGDIKGASLHRTPNVEEGSRFERGAKKIFMPWEESGEVRGGKDKVLKAGSMNVLYVDLECDSKVDINLEGLRPIFEGEGAENIVTYPVKVPIKGRRDLCDRVRGLLPRMEKFWKKELEKQEKAEKKEEKKEKYNLNIEKDDTRTLLSPLPKSILGADSTLNVSQGGSSHSNIGTNLPPSSPTAGEKSTGTYRLKHPALISIPSPPLHNQSTVNTPYATIHSANALLSGFSASILPSTNSLNSPVVVSNAFASRRANNDASSNPRTYGSSTSGNVLSNPPASARASIPSNVIFPSPNTLPTSGAINTPIAGSATISIVNASSTASSPLPAGSSLICTTSSAVEESEAESQALDQLFYAMKSLKKTEKYSSTMIWLMDKEIGIDTASFRQANLQSRLTNRIRIPLYFRTNNPGPVFCKGIEFQLLNKKAKQVLITLPQQVCNISSVYRNAVNASDEEKAQWYSNAKSALLGQSTQQEMNTRYYKKIGHSYSNSLDSLPFSLSCHIVSENKMKEVESIFPLFHYSHIYKKRFMMNVDNILLHSIFLAFLPYTVGKGKSHTLGERKGVSRGFLGNWVMINELIQNLKSTTGLRVVESNCSAVSLVDLTNDFLANESTITANYSVFSLFTPTPLNEPCGPRRSGSFKETEEEELSNVIKVFMTIIGETEEGLRVDFMKIQKEHPHTLLFNGRKRQQYLQYYAFLQKGREYVRDTYYLLLAILHCNNVILSCIYKCQLYNDIDMTGESVADDFSSSFYFSADQKELDENIEQLSKYLELDPVVEEESKEKKTEHKNELYYMERFQKIKESVHQKLKTNIRDYRQKWGMEKEEGVVEKIVLDNVGEKSSSGKVIGGLGKDKEECAGLMVPYDKSSCSLYWKLHQCALYDYLLAPYWCEEDQQGIMKDTSEEKEVKEGNQGENEKQGGDRSDQWQKKKKKRSIFSNILTPTIDTIKRNIWDYYNPSNEPNTGKGEKEKESSPSPVKSPAKNDRTAAPLRTRVLGNKEGIKECCEGQVQTVIVDIQHKTRRRDSLMLLDKIIIHRTHNELIQQTSPPKHKVPQGYHDCLHTSCLWMKSHFLPCLEIPLSVSRYLYLQELLRSFATSADLEGVREDLALESIKNLLMDDSEMEEMDQEHSIVLCQWRLQWKCQQSSIHEDVKKGGAGGGTLSCHLDPKGLIPLYFQSYRRRHYQGELSGPDSPQVFIYTRVEEAKSPDTEGTSPIEKISLGLAIAHGVEMKFLLRYISSSVIGDVTISNIFYETCHLSEAGSHLSDIIQSNLKSIIPLPPIRESFFTFVSSNTISITNASKQQGSLDGNNIMSSLSQRNNMWLSKYLMTMMLRGLSSPDRESYHDALDCFIYTSLKSRYYYRSVLSEDVLNSYYDYYYPLLTNSLSSPIPSFIYTNNNEVCIDVYIELQDYYLYEDDSAPIKKIYPLKVKEKQALRESNVIRGFEIFWDSSYFSHSLSNNIRPLLGTTYALIETESKEKRSKVTSKNTYENLARTITNSNVVIDNVSSIKETDKSATTLQPESGMPKREIERSKTNVMVCEVKIPLSLLQEACRSKDPIEQLEELNEFINEHLMIEWSDYYLNDIIQSNNATINDLLASPTAVLINRTPFALQCLREGIINTYSHSLTQLYEDVLMHAENYSKAFSIATVNKEGLEEAVSGLVLPKNDDPNAYKRRVPIVISDYVSDVMEVLCNKNRVSATLQLYNVNEEIPIVPDNQCLFQTVGYSEDANKALTSVSNLYSVKRLQKYRCRVDMEASWIRDSAMKAAEEEEGRVRVQYYLFPVIEDKERMYISFVGTKLSPGSGDKLQGGVLVESWMQEDVIEVAELKEEKYTREWEVITKNSGTCQLGVAIRFIGCDKNDEGILYIHSTGVILKID